MDKMNPDDIIEESIEESEEALPKWQRKRKN